MVARDRDRAKRTFAGISYVACKFVRSSVVQVRCRNILKLGLV